jgi:hypothetical protein
MSLSYFIRCTLFGRCIDESRYNEETVAQTKALLQETRDEWEPVKAAIDREAKSRPDLARLLTEVRATHERAQ